jgi:hypothetical protein
MAHVAVLTIIMNCVLLSALGGCADQSEGCRSAVRTNSRPVRAVLSAELHVEQENCEFVV